MQKIIAIGNLCADPESRTTTNGTNVCVFTVAVDRRRPDRNGQKQTDYFRVNTFNKQAENCQRFLAKGKKVAVVGELQARTYDDKSGKTRVSLDISADEVEFLSPKAEAKPLDAPALDGFQSIPESDLPF